MEEQKTVLVVYSSPRKNSNSDKLADSFIDGIKAQENADKFNIIKANLKGKKIEPCIACDYCKTHNGQCWRKDDMAEFTKTLETVDVIVFATPLHYFTFSSQLKCFIDRTYAFSGTNRPYNIKKAYLLATGGDTNLKVFDGMVATFESICNYEGWKIGGTVLAPGLIGTDDIIKTPEPLKKANDLGKALTI